MKKNLLLIFDTHALLHRAYHAFPPLTNSTGVPLNAAFGFSMMLLKSIQQFDPQYVICASDAHGPTFRKIKVESYKANRTQVPDELISQMAVMKEITSALGIPLIEKVGFEADDIVGTIVKKLAKTNINVRVITGDKDLLQLINPNTKIVLPGKSFSDIKVYSEIEFEERFGFSHEYYIDYKAIVGDTSDNIIGIKGIGEKTATDLVKKYGTIEEIIKNLDQEKPRVKTLFLESTQKIEENRFLATIDQYVDIDFVLENCMLNNFDREKAVKLFEFLEFKSLLKMIPKSSQTPSLEMFDEIAIESQNNCDQNLVAICQNKHDIMFYEPTTQKTYIFTGNLESILNSSSIQKLVFNIKSLRTDFLTPYDDVILMQYSLDSRIKLNITNPKKVYEIFNNLEPLIKENVSASRIYYRLEKPLVHILYEMEKTGIKVDKNALEKLSVTYQQLIEETKKKIFESVGHEFNPASTKELGYTLFEELKLPVGRKNKTGFSTDDKVLEKLVGIHPIVEYIRTYRETTKMKSTFIEGMLKSIGSDGRIHTDYNQYSVSTGRLSSSNPNLQNIPIKSSNDVRKIFVANPGYKLISFDYSQIELRIMAHLANDPNMIAAFVNGEDIHAKTAALLFTKDIKDVSKSDRSFAKTINFGILYGMGEFGLAMRSNMDIKDARKFIADYWDKFPTVKKYLDSIIESTKRLGYAQTLFGRKRYFDFEHAPHMVRQGMIREAINMPIQGTAADIMKLAMIKVWTNLSNFDVKLLLQIHDELVFEIKDDENIERFKEYVKENMTNVMKLSVPLEVGIGIGNNLAEVK